METPGEDGLHFHTAALLLYSGGVAVNALSGTELGTAVAWLAVLLLLFLSLRHVYEEGFVRTAAKQAALLFVHVLAIAMGSFALLVVTGLTA